MASIPKTSGPADHSAEFYRSIVEAATTAMLLVNRQGLITFANGYTGKLFGYQLEELQGRPLEVLIPERFRSGHPEKREGFFEAPETRVMGQGRDLFGLRKDGSEFPVEIGLNPIETPDGIQSLAVISNITERKEAENTIQRHREELEQAVKDAEERVRQQQEDLLELSTPVLKIWEGVLAMPLIGTLDSRRTEDAMEKALTELSEERAKVLIIDITGVPMVDTMVANHLIRMASAVRLMGGESIITGMKPATAKTVVQLGVDLSHIQTAASLATGLAKAIQLVEER